MIPYLIVATIPFILEICLNSTSFSTQKKRKILLCFSSLAIFVLIGFKSITVGSGDSWAYSKYWTELRNYDFSSFVIFAKMNRIEIGFLFSVWGFSHVFVWNQFIFIFSALLFTLSISFFCNKYCEDLALSLTMFICLGLMLFMMQGMRQAIAMSILLFSIEDIKKRKLFPFLLLNLLAFLFHKTSVVFIPCFFLPRIKTSGLAILLTTVFCVVVLFFSKNIINVFNSVLNMNYNDATTKGAGYVALAVYVLILVFAVLMKPKKEDIDFSLFFYMTLVGAVAYLMRYFGVAIAERISFYFMFGQMALLSMALTKYKAGDRFYSVTRTAIFILCIALFTYRLKGTDLIPYSFFWE